MCIAIAMPAIEISLKFKELMIFEGYKLIKLREIS